MTITQQRADKGRLHSEMMTLRARFTRSDGNTGNITWTHADAERRYNELRKAYDKLEEKKEGLNGNRTS